MFLAAEFAGPEAHAAACRIIPVRYNPATDAGQRLARSIPAGYQSGLMGRIANPLFVGSNPTPAFSALRDSCLRLLLSKRLAAGSVYLLQQAGQPLPDLHRLPRQLMQLL